MGAIEPLLGIVEMKNATGLVLSMGEVPTLIVPSGRSPLTMPALSATMMDHLLGDLFSPEQRAALTSAGTLDAGYRSNTYGAFAILARSTGGKLTVTLTRGSPTPAPAPAPAAVSVAPAPRASPVSAPRAEAKREAPSPPSPSSDAFSAVLDEALGRLASDVLFSAGTPPLLRVDGELIECRTAPAMTAEAIRGYFEPRVPGSRRAAYDATGSSDFALVHGPVGDPASVRFRVNLFRHAGGVAAALRPIWTEVPSLASLHLPSGLTQLVELRHGLVLVTGTTGSGKSTTLAALLEHVNRTRAAHIVTLEDPIEYAYRRRRSIVHQRELGEHVDSFTSGLRAALRENPDILLVGEMREPEAIRLALTAAQTGHLVLSTLHSGSAGLAVERLLAGFAESEQPQVRQEVAATLRFVVAQQLLPATSGGRVPAVEVLAINHAVAAQIREGRTHMLATQMDLGADDGMVSMARALADLVRSGRINRSTALAACDDRAALEKLLEERPGSRLR